MPQNRKQQQREQLADWTRREREELPTLDSELQRKLQDAARVTAEPVGRFLALVDEYATNMAREFPQSDGYDATYLRYRTSGFNVLIQHFDQIDAGEYPSFESDDEAKRNAVYRAVDGLIGGAVATKASVDRAFDMSTEW